MIMIIIIIIIIISIMMMIIIIIIIQTLAKTIYLIHTYPNALYDQPCHELLSSSNYSLSNPDQITNIVPRCPQR